jgi:hypothetical protein
MRPAPSSAKIEHHGSYMKNDARVQLAIACGTLAMNELEQAAGTDRTRSGRSVKHWAFKGIPGAMADAPGSTI